MGRLRIGELLWRMGILSRHDIDEILEEQIASHHRFGDIALTWGLCQPEQIWKVCCDQLWENGQRVDLETVGIDAQAAEAMPDETARLHGMMPFRIYEGQLIVAVAGPVSEDVGAMLSRLVHLTLRFVPADPLQIQAAQERYYPARRSA